jgi:hypothetical protein
MRCLSTVVALPFLWAAQVASADVISVDQVTHGSVVTEAQCAKTPETVWVSAMGKNICMRYFLSKAGGSGQQPVVFLQGDLDCSVDLKKLTCNFPPGAKGVNTDNLMTYADTISNTDKTTAIYLARMGRDGSSGYFALRHTELELQITNAALDAIKKRYGLEGYNIYGHSGGAGLVAALVGLRNDIKCDVPADGFLSIKTKDPANPSFLRYNPVDLIPKIVQNHSARLLVVTDPHDQTVSIDQQLPFVEKLAAAHGQVEQFFVDASGGADHHFTTPYASLVMRDCLLGESNDQVALDLSKLVEQRLEAAAAKAPGDANETDR